MVLSNAAGGHERSPYGQAIDATRDAIVRRSAQYKWLVIGVSLGSAACLLSTWLAHDWRVLLLLLWLPASVLVFYALDFRAVQRWRLGILVSWARGELTLPLLAQTLRQVPAVPPNTLEGMLASLPTWPPDSIPATLRVPLCRLQAEAAGIATRRLWVRAAVWLMGWCSVSAAWVWHMAPLLGGLVSIPLISWSWLIGERFALRRQSIALAQAADAVGTARAQLSNWAEAVCWEGVPVSLRQFCLAAFMAAGRSETAPACHR